jgi:hypothetical protein
MVVLAILGGGYFGLFSCGGYAWHRYAFVSAHVALSLAVAVSAKGPWLGRTFLFLAVGPAYVLGQALTGPFYTATPASWVEYWRGFVHTLQYGPC